MSKVFDAADEEWLRQLRKTAGRVCEIAPHCEGEANVGENLVRLVLQDVMGHGRDPRQVAAQFPIHVDRSRERVDYALLRDGAPVVLIEVKANREAMDSAAVAQLHRYFGATERTARAAILTEGTEWQFFADLAEVNRLDREPFFVFDFTDFDDAAGLHLRTACRACLADPRREPMRALRLRADIREWLQQQRQEVDQDFAKLVTYTLTGSRSASRIDLVQTILTEEIRTLLVPPALPIPAPPADPPVPPLPPPTLPAPRPKHHLAVVLDGERISSEDSGRDAQKVLLEALKWIWALDVGRPVLSGLAGQLPHLHRGKEGAPRSAKLFEVGDGIFVNVMTDNGRKWRLIDRLRNHLPPEVRQRIILLEIDSYRPPSSSSEACGQLGEAAAGPSQEEA